MAAAGGSYQQNQQLHPLAHSLYEKKKNLMSHKWDLWHLSGFSPVARHENILYIDAQIYKSILYVALDCISTVNNVSIYLINRLFVYVWAFIQIHSYSTGFSPVASWKHVQCLKTSRWDKISFEVGVWYTKERSNYASINIIYQF